MGKEFILKRILDYAVDGDSIWLITTEFPNFFFKYNLHKKEFECMVKFPDSIRGDGVPFRYVRKVEREIYFFSEEINEIYIWGIDTGEFQTVNFGNEEDGLFKGKKIYPIESEKYVYCISIMSLILVQIDKKSKECKLVDISCGHSIAANRMTHMAYYSFFPCLYHKKVLIPIQDKIISYDEERGATEIFADTGIQMRSLDDGFSDYLFGVVCCNDRLVVFTYCVEVFVKEETGFRKVERDNQEEVILKGGYYRPVFIDVSVFDQESIFLVYDTHYAYRCKVDKGYVELVKHEFGEDVLINGSTIKKRDNDYCIITSWDIRDAFNFNVIDGHVEKFQIGFDLNRDDFYGILHDAGMSGIISADCLEGLFGAVNYSAGIEENSKTETVGARIYKNSL